VPVIPISDPSDPRLARYRDLKRNDHRGETPTDDLFVAEGEKLVLRLLASPCETASILTSEATLDRIAPHVPEGLPVYVLPSSALSELVGFRFHRGVLACGRRPLSVDPRSLLATASERGRALIVACPELRDPDNLGAIARTARAFGAAGLMVGIEGTEPLTRRTLRTSMGALLELPVSRVSDWGDLLRTARDAGFVSVATVLSDDARPLDSLPGGAAAPERVLVLLGNEDEGLPDEIARSADVGVVMPMAAGVDSLNVAVAAGIVLHHFRRV
jgi:tRNA G18 (ribose-2'-O)-methylase SpoU